MGQKKLRKMFDLMKQNGFSYSFDPDTGELYAYIPTDEQMEEARYIPDPPTERSIELQFQKPRYTYDFNGYRNFLGADGPEVVIHPELQDEIDQLSPHDRAVFDDRLRRMAR